MSHKFSERKIRNSFDFEFFIFHFLSGSAYTYSANPVCGGLISGVIVFGTSQGLPPPRPVVTAMYCFPPMLYETGNPCTAVASFVSQSTLPFLASTALNI